MIGDLITRDVQLELGGRVAGRGTDVEIVAFNPWVAPVLRTNRSNRGQAHGSYAGADLLGSRLVPVELLTMATTKSAALSAMLGFTAAFGPADAEQGLVWQEDGTKYVLFGQPVLADPNPEYLAQGAVDIAARFEATDPRIYSLLESTGSVGFPSGGTGRTYDLTFPRTYGASGADGIVTATNAGTFPTPWTATITGPWVNPTIQRVDTGDTLSLAISITSGEVLTVDSRERSLVLNAAASRNNTVRPSSRWFDLGPGATAVRFGGASGSGTAELAWRSAWL